MQRWIANATAAAMLAGCGPTVAGPASNETSGTGSEGLASDEGAEDSTATATGAEVPMPAGCDRRWDTERSSGEVIWTRSFPTAGKASMNGVTVSGSAAVFAVGSRAQPSRAEDGWLLHLGPDGTLEHEVVQEVREDVEFEDVALTPDGHAIIVGYEQRGSEQPETIALSVAPDGAIAWREFVDVGLATDSGFRLRRVAVSTSGRIVLGATGHGGDDATAGLVELSSAGEQLRALRLPAEVEADHALRDLGFDGGEVLYVGLSRSSSPSPEDREWVGRWGDDGVFLGAWEHREFGARAVEIRPDLDGVTVLGAQYASDEFPFTVRPLLRRYDATGEELWAHVIEMDDIGVDVLTPLELVTDCRGHSLVYASHSPSGGGINQWLFTYDEDGLEVDRRIIELSEDPETSGPGIYDLSVDPFGNLVLAMADVQIPGGLVVEKRAR